MVILLIKINTNLQGEKSYGVCVIIYEKIKGNVKKSYQQLLNKWISQNIVIIITF